MIELPLDYMNKLASQTQFISALLCGFSLTVLVLLFEKKNSDRVMINIFRFAILATGAFLVSIFSMTNIYIVTIEGYPFQTKSSDLVLPRILGVVSFFIGIISITIIISLFGWTKSKSLGQFSTAIGVLTLIFILLMLV
jgi:hypothetical protein